MTELGLELPPAPPSTSLNGLAIIASPKTKSKPKSDSNPNNQCLLPCIDPATSGMVSVVKSEAQPSSDFLPPDLLLTLKRQENNEIHPGSMILPQYGAGKDTKHAPASLWNHSSRRNRLKHLTNSPPCVCGAGKDISFLYDSYTEDEKQKKKKFWQNADTIIPEEYHFVKHPGVIGLEFHEDDYTAKTKNHDHHMTIFPSTNPSGRHEVISLKHTLDTMLRRAGVPTMIEDADLQGPTEMHRLLDLIQKEQTIYNLVFHELIRQVSVQCVERGELLAEIRRRYANLLDRIPRQVKSLHNDVVAQRTLDRKLTNELKRFKNRVASLTDELFMVREHDLVVTQQSRDAEAYLTSALADSKRNASLLDEYHELYELQRKRMEEQLSHMTYEQDLWKQAAYDLSWRVASEFNLLSFQTLQLNERTWCKLAGHFIIILSSKDTKQVSEVQEVVQEWKERMKAFLINLYEIENTMKENMMKVRDGLSKWIKEFSKTVTPEGVVKVPPRAEMKNLWSELQVWQEIINAEADKFAGTALLSNLEELKYLASLVEKWTETALRLFMRHQRPFSGSSSVASGTSYGASETALQNKKMVQLNRVVDTKLTMCRNRSAGENGVATGLVHLITPLESWDTKFSILLATSDRKLFLADSDWIKFGRLLLGWREKVDDILHCIGSMGLRLPESDSSESQRTVTTTTTTSSDIGESGGSYETMEESEEEEEEKEEPKEEKKAELKEDGEDVKGEEGKEEVKEEREEGMKEEEGKEEVKEEKEKGKEKVKEDEEGKEEVEKGEEEEEKEVKEGEETKEVKEQEKGIKNGRKEEEVIKRKGREREKEVLDRTVSEVTFDELNSELDSWCSGLAYAIDSQDTKMSEEVTRLHSELIKWMVQLLLYMTETELEKERKEEEKGKEKEEGEEKEGEEKENEDLKCSHHRHIQSIGDIRDNYLPLANMLTHITGQLNQNCMDVVREIIDERIKEDYPNPEEEQMDLKRMVDEAQEWVKLADLLLNDVIQGRTERARAPSRDISGSSVKGQETAASLQSKAQKIRVEVTSEDKTVILKKDTIPVGGQDGDGVGLLPKEMKVMGEDHNIHQMSFQKALDETPTPPIATSTDLGLVTEDILPEGRKALLDDAEMLLLELEKTKKLLQEQETLTKETEEQAGMALKELEISKGTIAQLEEELVQVRAELAEEKQHQNKTHLRLPKNTAGHKTSKKGITSRPHGRK